MSAAVGSVGQLSYGSFYLSSLAFGYLSIQPANSLSVIFPQVPLLGPMLEPVYLFYFLTAVAFLGAVQAHGIARAVYGPDGPTVRPKHETVQIRHELAVVLGVDAEDIPITPCRIAQRGVMSETLRLMAGSTSTRHRLKSGIEQCLELRALLRWWKVPRVIYFIPMGVLKYLTWVSFLALVGFTVFGTTSYVAVLLLFAHIILIFRKLLWFPIPNYRNADALDDRFVAEYEIGKKED